MIRAVSPVGIAPRTEMIVDGGRHSGVQAGPDPRLRPPVPVEGDVLLDQYIDPLHQDRGRFGGVRIEYPSAGFTDLHREVLMIFQKLVCARVERDYFRQL